MEGTTPVNKKLAAALSGGAVLVLALSGCGGDDGNEELDNWAKSVCDAWQPQVDKIKAANDSIQKETSDDSKPEDVKRVDSKAFQDMSDAYKAMAQAVDKAGAPPVEDGKQDEGDAVEELNAISASYADLKKQVDALDTKDQAKFAEGLRGVQASLDKINKSGTDALDKLQSGEVADAMRGQESCKSAASPVPSSGKA
ncbi:small secreted protein [Streptomyces sp. NPDC060194]|uniref:small secreted protein n=1 Tax=Streptomyces sp. NPDC060194 TaxID=3347069 RepID=UPI00366843F2